MKEFYRDRDEALLSLDEAKLRAYLAKYGERGPPAPAPLAFWAGCHKSILSLGIGTLEQRTKSREWLSDNGFEVRQ